MVTFSTKQHAELGELLEITSKEKPKRADVDRLQAYLIEHPDHASDIGNLALQMQVSILSQAFRNYQGIDMVVAAHCSFLKGDLGYNAASIIEKLLIDHIIVCWLRMYDCEMRFEMVRSENISLAQGLYWEKKLSAAQRRYLRAIETLARVRKIDPIALQVNIGQHQQINLPGA